MEFFKNVNVDWMGKKWYFLGFSLIVTVAGLLSIFFWHGIPLGVDFKGGTVVTVKFATDVHPDEVRKAVEDAHVKDARVQGIGPASGNEFRISLESKLDENALESGKVQIINALNNSPLKGKFEVRNPE